MSTFQNDALNMVSIRPRDLEPVDRVLYEEAIEETTARRAVSIKNDVSPGAETYVYKVRTRAGEAIIIGSKSDDLPTVSVGVKEETVRIYSIGTSMEWTVQELRAAQMAGVPLETDQADAARMAINEKENQLFWKGDARYNITGLANATGIQVTAVETTSGGSTDWDDKTPEEILEDVRLARGLITVLPGQGEGNLVLALPPTKYERLTQRYNQYDSRSLMEVIRTNNWFTEILRVPELVGAGAGGTDSMMVFDNRPRTVQLLVPMEMMRHQPEFNFPWTKVAVEERTGGAIVRYPRAVVRADGI